MTFFIVKKDADKGKMIHYMGTLYIHFALLIMGSL